MARRSSEIESTPEAAYEAAIRMLARKSRSTGEVRAKLIDGGASDETVDGVIGRLKSQRHLDDAVLAGDEAFALIDSKGLAPELAIHKLVERGLAEPVARDAVRAAVDGRSDAELCKRALARKQRGRPLATTELAKAGRALARLGYEEDVVTAALSGADRDGGE